MLSKLSSLKSAPSLIAMSLMVAFAGCGGGGGSSEELFNGAGVVHLTVSPATIDVGDRALLRVTIRDINDDGALVKVRFPENLSFVQDSALLRVNGKETRIAPDVQARAGRDDRYLVFFISPLQLNDKGDGVLEFQLLGVEELTNGLIEIDIDVDNPLVPNDSEFDPEAPEFQAEDEVDIDIVE